MSAPVRKGPSREEKAMTLVSMGMYLVQLLLACCGLLTILKGSRACIKS